MTDDIKKLKADNKLMREFLSKIVTLGGPYDYVNGTVIVTDTYSLIEKVDGRLPDMKIPGSVAEIISH